MKLFRLQAFGDYKESDRASTLKQRDYKDVTDLVVCGGYAMDNMIAAVNFRNGTESEVNGALQVKEQGYNLNSNNTVRVCGAVRRLTPIECERLQGFLDGWTDIGEYTDGKGKKKQTSDSARYKALGNSIALPFWQYLARRICAQYERDITMGSLFDGIGGFPLVFSRCGATPVWASEIEDFPIAVTKRHFPENERTE